MTISNLATCLRTPDLTSRGSLVDKVSTLIECLCKPSDGTDKRIEASHAAERAFDASIEAEKIIADLLTRVVDLEHLVQMLLNHHLLLRLSFYLHSCLLRLQHQDHVRLHL